MIRDIQDVSFNNEVLQSDRPVLVDFYSPRCIPCKSVLAKLAELNDEIDNRAKIVTMNVCDSPNTSAMFSIMSVPTVMMFNKGRVVSAVIGNRKKEDYLDLIKEAYPA